MTTVASVLIEGKQAESTETTQYTSTNVTTIIDKFTAMNTTGGAVTITVSLVANGGSAAAGSRVITVSILAGKTYTFPELVGHTLMPGDFISTIAGAATSISIRASGRQIT